MQNSSIEKFIRAANYLTTAQIFLKDNFLMERELTFDDVKPRLLGHWGSGPGVTFSYAHLSLMAKKYEQKIMYVLGPGHAFPALQASLLMEGSLTRFYPDVQQNAEGVAKVCREFSWPYGFPSHSNPTTPGVITEGGELGYSLSTAYGAVLDNPDLMVACLIGDGEAETGPLASSWHINKIVNPRTDGVVLPILHLNGYKISGPTVFGRMSNYELMTLFSGYGYHPRIVDVTKADDPHQEMQDALDWAYQLVQDIRDSSDDITPHMPMIIMRTLKGWTGPKYLGDQKVEGNALSHQVVLSEAKTDESQLKQLSDWLKSYRFNELFDPEMGFGDYVKDIVPSDPDLWMGSIKNAHGGEGVYKPLNLPDVRDFMEDATAPGTMGSSSMRRVGEFMAEVFRRNEENKNFRFMSPDETYSNKLDESFKATSRAWMWPMKDWDQDMSRTGRVMEMLSEHNLQGITQGYVLTGRHAFYASYEAFIQVVASMMDQYAKFLKHAREVEWRGDVPSLNYILTSSGWRQDHNGFSHQNPGFVDEVLRRSGDFVNVYFPPDGNSALVSARTMLASKKEINVLIAGKTLEPRWLTPELAERQVEEGVMVWDFASDDNPDLVMTGIGDYPVKESMAAIDLIKQENFDLRIRMVCVSALTSSGIGRGGYCMNHDEFDQIFTADKPVVFNFHGYPETVKAILFNYAHHPDRFDVRGYVEQGSTTTPFDMHVRNNTSRYHLVMAAFDALGRSGRVSWEEADRIRQKYQALIDENTEFIKVHGIDMPELDAWVWPAARHADRTEEEVWFGKTD